VIIRLAYTMRLLVSSHTMWSRIESLIELKTSPKVKVKANVEGSMMMDSEG
jgi:hypothetical protein